MESSSHIDKTGSTGQRFLDTYKEVLLSKVTIATTRTTTLNSNLVGIGYMNPQYPVHSICPLFFWLLDIFY